MRVVRETKLDKDKLDKLKDIDFNSSALELIDKAIDKALRMNGSQDIIEEILSMVNYEFKIKEGFKEFLLKYSVEELEPLRDFIKSGISYKNSIEAEGRHNIIWDMKSNVDQKLASIFSDLYEQVYYFNSRRARGKGEYLVSILFGREAKFTSDFDLEARDGKKIEIKAYNGRLDGNYTKAASVSPVTCYKILERIFGIGIINGIKNYCKQHGKIGSNDLFVYSNSKKRTIPGIDPIEFNLEKKSSFILGLGKRNIKRNWKDFIDGLVACGMSENDILKNITQYLQELCSERYSRNKQEAIKSLVDSTCKEIAEALMANNDVKALSKVAELELILFVEAATPAKIERNIELVLIGKTLDDNIRILALDLNNSSFGKRLGKNVENGNVKTNKFDSSSQGSNIGLKLDKTYR